MLPIPPEVRTRHDLAVWMRLIFPRRFAEIMKKDLELLNSADPAEALYRRHFRRT